MQQRSSGQPMDVVEELRLRRWARENHVPAAERDGLWHPVILEEMCRRDLEMSEKSDLRRGLVPLQPIVRLLHGAHLEAQRGETLLSVPEIMDHEKSQKSRS